MPNRCRSQFGVKGRKRYYCRDCYQGIVKLFYRRGGGVEGTSLALLQLIYECIYDHKSQLLFDG
jgi:hypothetical protein